MDNMVSTEEDEAFGFSGGDAEVCRNGPAIERYVNVISRKDEKCGYLLKKGISSKRSVEG